LLPLNPREREGRRNKQKENPSIPLFPPRRWRQQRGCRKTLAAPWLCHDRVQIATSPGQEKWGSAAHKSWGRSGSKKAQAQPCARFTLTSHIPSGSFMASSTRWIASDTIGSHCPPTVSNKLIGPFKGNWKDTLRLFWIGTFYMHNPRVKRFEHRKSHIYVQSIIRV
jgi:hypothetical protein